MNKIALRNGQNKTEDTKWKKNIICPGLPFSSWTNLGCCYKSSIIYLLRSCWFYFVKIGNVQQSLCHHLWQPVFTIVIIVFLKIGWFWTKWRAVRVTQSDVWQLEVICKEYVVPGVMFRILPKRHSKIIFLWHDDDELNLDLSKLC